MADELDDFTAQLNKAEDDEGQANNAGPPAGAPGGMPPGMPPGLPPGMTPQQYAYLMHGKKMFEQQMSKALAHEALKGKVDLKWYGHAGFKIQFKDQDDVQRCIYIDIWIENEHIPDKDKEQIPNDCDLALVTHGQGDASMHSPGLIKMGKRENRKLVCSTEVGLYYE